MDFSSPRFVLAHAVLGLPEPLAQNPAVDDAFMASVAHEFPNLMSRQPVLPNVPVVGPRLILASKSSQLALSAGQADFEVGFYGAYIDDIEKGLEYVGRKLDAVRQGFEAVKQTPANVGVVTKFNFSLKESGGDGAAHILSTHLRSAVDPGDVQDATARIAFKVRDKYFASFAVGNYETRVWQRPIFPGMAQTVAIKPWEATLQDFGIELTVDINNGLEGRVQEADAEVSEQGVAAVLAMLGKAARDAGPRFVESGDVQIADLVEEPAA